MVELTGDDIQSWSLNSAVGNGAGSRSSAVKISWHDFGTSIVRLRDHKDPEQCGQHTPLSRTHREKTSLTTQCCCTAVLYSSNPPPLEAQCPVRQASYACGKTARQKNLTAIHTAEGVVAGSMATAVMWTKGAHDWAAVEDQEDVAEAVGLDGVEKLTEYLNETWDEGVEKNVSDDEKEESEDDSGGRAVPPPYAELSSHFRALESVAEKCGMKEAAHHLQKVKMAMIHAHASRPARQTYIRAFAAVTERDDGERGGSGSVS